MATEIKKIIIRRDSADKWAENNPILSRGEIGIDTSNGNMKVGDGTTPWASLPTEVDKARRGLDAVVAEQSAKIQACEAKVAEQVEAIDEFKEAVVTHVEAYKPIEINGDVTNAPDEEDITSEDNLLKIKNRSSLNGMGYIILRKGSLSPQLTQSNTIYEVRYLHDLGGDVELPIGCVLHFNGGRISNGKLIGSDTIIRGDYKIFDNVEFAGTWNVEHVDVRWFDVVVGSEVDNHDAIIAAIKAAKEMKVGCVQFPSGVIHTSPIEVKGASQLLFKGNSGRAYYYNDSDRGTIIRAISQGYCLFQLCSHEDNRVSPYGEWSSYSVTIDGINFDGNNMVDHCVSGNWAFYFYNGNAKYAKSHGIVVEDYGYPVIIEKVISQHNGGAGILVKGPSTTVVTLRDVECQYNQGCGIRVEGIAFSTWSNVTLQANKGGGLVIQRLNESYNDPNNSNAYFTYGLTIHNLYCEANGRDDDGKLIPNTYGVWIGCDIPMQPYTGRPQHIKLVGGAVDDNSGIYCNCVNVLDLDITYEKFTLGEVAYCASIMDRSVGASTGISSRIDKSKAVTSYIDRKGEGRGDMPFLNYRCGISYERGRLQEVLFAFDFTNIEEYKGQTFRMKLSDAAGAEQKYIIPGKSSIASIYAYKADAQYSHQGNTAYAETFKGSAEFRVYAGSLLYSRNAILPIMSYDGDGVLTLVNGDDTFNGRANKGVTYPLLTNKPKVLYSDAESCGMYVDVTLSEDWEWAKYGDREQDKTLYCKVVYEY